MTSRCPACGGRAELFYTLDGIPAGSCVLLTDRDAARRYPSGDLHLSHCASCGFIHNAAFGEGLVDYTSGYEASQAFSPTFRAFVEDLVGGLVDRHGLDGATVVEPGCGNGEFLDLVTARVGGRGIGLDPAYNGRPTSDSVVIHRERLGPHSDPPVGDLVVARHTLEHIEGVVDFVGGLRAALAPDRPAVALIEVPESLRILREGAFWDVYYEHAAYFTAGSVWRLLAAAGLRPLSIETAFAGQYLLVEAARDDDAADREGCREPDDLSETAQAVDGFARLVDGQVNRWGDIVSGAERPLIWGASSKAVAFLAAVGGVDYATDINPAKHGSFLAGSGAEVLDPADVPEFDPDLVIVMNPIYEEEIAESLAEAGMQPAIRSLGSPPPAG